MNNSPPMSRDGQQHKRSSEIHNQVNSKANFKRQKPEHYDQKDESSCLGTQEAPLENDADTSSKASAYSAEEDSDAARKKDPESASQTLIAIESGNPFPGKLMDLLDSGVASDAMWWHDNGDCFCVVPKLFAEKVLDKYFQGTKFESFTRKLNRWGFKRAAGHHVPKNAIAFYHKKFQRGKRELLGNFRTGEKRNEKAGQPLMQGTGEVRQARSSVRTDQPREAGVNLSNNVPFPAGNLDGLDLAAHNFLHPNRSFTSQFLPRVASSQLELSLQQLLTQRESTRTAQALQQPMSLTQLQAQLLAAENSELNRILMAGNASMPQQHSLDHLTARMTSLASQLAQHNGAPERASVPNNFSGIQFDPAFIQYLLDQQRQRRS